jgi:hypothetical protein
VNGNGQWKWIAGILGALMVGFLPGYISSRDAPSSADFSEIQQSQQQTEVKLAILGAQNARIIKTMEEARKRIIALQAQHQR